MIQNQTLRLKIAVLFANEGLTPPAAVDIFQITPLVLKQFGHLPQPVNVICEADEVVIQYRAALPASGPVTGRHTSQRLRAPYVRLSCEHT